MHYAEIKEYDIANGPGIRVSLFVSGCPHHCKGCFNEVTWDFNYGLIFDESAKSRIMTQLKKDYIQGLTLLGGEPLAPENRSGVCKLLKEVKTRFPSKDVWCYTGYLWDIDILGEAINYIDVLVDGPFMEERKDISLRFKGSDNQRIINVKRTLKTGNIVLL